jgi:DNA-binding response OmpR family regulator
VRILIVDDQPEMLSVIATMLAPTGHDLVLHDDPKKALEQMRSEHFDVLVTDMLMPGVRGIDIIRELRREKAELWIVAISGGGDTMMEKTMLRISEAYGADRILYKPFRKSELLAAVERS